MPSATIQKIIGIEPIKGADRIELASILGWKCVVSKSDNFKVGDKVVFIEVDSVVPDRPEFEFMKDRNFRVRSMKLRGQLSQGLILSIYPWLDNLYINPDYDCIGIDVSEFLGVTHYEKPIPAHLMGQIRGSFPTHLVPKTDEIRIQSEPDLIEEIKSKPVYITTKCDGTSATYVSHMGEFYICSRNNIMKDNGENKTNVYVQMAHKYDLQPKMQAYDHPLAIQGEICGPGIQGNPMGLKELQLFVFNIYDIDARKYLDYEDFVRKAKDFDLQTVPIDLIDVFLDDFTLERYLELATGLYVGTKNQREGIVIRPMVETGSYVLRGRLSFKCLNNLYKGD